MKLHNVQRTGAAALAWLLAAGMMSAPVSVFASSQAAEEDTASGFSANAWETDVGDNASYQPEYFISSSKDVDSSPPVQDNIEAVTQQKSSRSSISVITQDESDSQEITSNTETGLSHAAFNNNDYISARSETINVQTGTAITNEQLNTVQYDDSVEDEMIFDLSDPRYLAMIEDSYAFSAQDSQPDEDHAAVGQTQSGTNHIGDTQQATPNTASGNNDSQPGQKTNDIGQTSHYTSLPGTGSSMNLWAQPAEYYAYYFNQLESDSVGFYSFIDAYDKQELMDKSYDSSIPSSDRVYIPYMLAEDEYVYIPCTKDEFESRTYRSTNEYQTFYVNKVKAYDCWLKDNPRFYWSNGINTITRLSYDEVNKVAVIKEIDFSLRQYYKGVLDEAKEVDASLSAAIAAVSKTLNGSKNRLDVFREAEKYINALASYDTPAASSSDMDKFGYAHTITGLLLDKYGHKSVCEGYAKLFKIICDEFEAPAIIVIGKSYSTLQNMDHMWNYALMRDGNWYLVDCTFDDSSGSMQWFLSGLDSGATRSNHVPVGRFSTGIMYEEVEYPALADKAYDQASDPGDDPGDDLNQDVWDFVTRLYRQVLQREPEERGLRNWYGLLMNGSETGSNVAYGFIFSKEYTSKETSNEDFVRMLYRTMMGRDGDSKGLASWLDLLKQGFSRKKIFEGFAKSEEFKNICKIYGIEAGSYSSNEFLDVNSQATMFVARLYLTCLQRTRIDQKGLTSWVTSIVEGYSGGKVAKKFFESKEFVSANHTDSEFVTLLYKTLFNREPDSSGYQTWTRSLARGRARESVLDSFITSKEFTNLCKTYRITP